MKETKACLAKTSKTETASLNCREQTEIFHPGGKFINANGFCPKNILAWCTTALNFICKSDGKSKAGRKSSAPEVLNE